MTNSRKDKTVNMKKNWMAWALTAILAAAVILPLVTALGGTVVMLLWNWLLPPLFGWHQVTFWQALGILVLTHTLFNNFWSYGAGRSGFRRHKWGHGDKDSGLREWLDMSPEEREKFRQGMGSSASGSKEQSVV
jgi:hypothetical protein